MTDDFIFATELRREPGASRAVTKEIRLSNRLGTEVIAVRKGDQLTLDLLLESVMDGILVSGTVSGTLHGECVRCLKELERDFSVPLTELYSYPDMVEEYQEEDEDPVPVVDEDTIDLFDLVVDSVVADLPFNPVCEEGCLGLCAQCGIDLNTDPDHEHEAPIDPRWAALRDLASNDDQ